MKSKQRTLSLKPIAGGLFIVLLSIMGGVLFITNGAFILADRSDSEQANTVIESPIPTLAPDAPFTFGVIEDGRITDPFYYITDVPLIVIGTIKEIQPPQWTTHDGKRPANPHYSPQNPEGGKNFIFRKAILTVDEYLKGSAPSNQLQIYLPGGTIGSDSIEVLTDDMLYDLQEGEHVVLFLRPYNTDRHGEGGGQPLFRLAEHYRILSNPATTPIPGQPSAQRNDTAGLEATNGHRTIPFDQLLGEVSNVLAGIPIPLPSSPPVPTPTEIIPTPTATATPTSN